jgi:hypothetical protein
VLVNGGGTGAAARELQLLQQRQLLLLGSMLQLNVLIFRLLQTLFRIRMLLLSRADLLCCITMQLGGTHLCRHVLLLGLGRR